MMVAATAPLAAGTVKEHAVITVHLRYEIDPDRLEEFTEYGRAWIGLVARFGGTHHGYFLPSEGDNDEAFALFTFPSLAEYERYRAASFLDEDCLRTVRRARETKCIRRYERRFLTPVFEAGEPPAPGADELAVAGV